MTALSAEYLTLLNKALEKDFVAHLLTLIDTTKPADQQRKKNLSRAFAAFAIANLCGVSPKEAAESVVDDFDDHGIDAVYYHGASETLYIVQAKLKTAEMFSQEEALAFCQGVRKLIAQDFTGFNTHVMNRQTELEDAVTSCSHIVLVIAHTGSGISAHASAAVANLLADESHGDERFKSPLTDYDAGCVVADLQSAKAYPRVDATLVLRRWGSQQEPRQTYFGFVSLADLARLYQKHGLALYAKNLRNPLGDTEVSKAVQETLATRPKDFVYLNNGVTALCDRIDPKDNKKAGKRLTLIGMSVINGAQTIATAAKFMTENSGHDISVADVLITVIKADADNEFGKLVTRARNHQNSVSLANFAALDDEQERLRRDLAGLDIHYAYKADDAEGAQDPQHIRIDEAAYALALLQPDPRFAVWLKKEPGLLMDTAKDPYKALFNSSLTAFQLANAVYFLRYVQARMVAEAKSASGQERLTYKHGTYGLGFVLAKRVATAIGGTALLDNAKLATVLSPEFDKSRQALWTAVQARVGTKGPLALFRNQAETIPLLRKTMIAHYGLTSDPAIGPLAAKVTPGELYPQALFGYLAAKAPQIGNLT